MPLADFSLAVIAWLMICAIGMALVVSGRDPQSKKIECPGLPAVSAYNTASKGRSVSF